MLLDQGADVLTQHQDCTKTVIEATEAAGAFSVGYHYDASALAPEGWLTGSEWAWTDLYSDVVAMAKSGEFAACLAWSGDIIQLQQERPDIRFVIPTEGGIRWFDSMVIPARSGGAEAAAKARRGRADLRGGW